jgi:hypothetical protein
MKECLKCELCFGDDVNLCPNDQTQTRLTLPGTQLLAKRYFIEKRLGRGAMGQVYLARDENLGTRQVAVKTVRQDILNSDDLQEGEAIARFEREARSAASIRHPNIVDVTDFGETEDGVFYLVMEYVEGETLHRLLRREGTLTVKRAVMMQVLFRLLKLKPVRSRAAQRWPAERNDTSRGETPRGGGRTGRGLRENIP